MFPLLAATLLGAVPSVSDPRPQVPPEFGAVHWGRDLEPALAASRKSEKPVMLLFQEVPG